MFRLYALMLFLIAAPVGAAMDSKQKELSELRERIAQLREEVERASEDRKEAADGLRDSEKRISEINRTLRKLQKDERRIDSDFRRLKQEQSTIESQVQTQEVQLAELLRLRYSMQADVDVFRLLLSERNPVEIQRDWGYFAYIGNARLALIEDYRNTLDQLVNLEEQTRLRQSELSQVKRDQLNQRKVLNEEKLARKSIYEELSQQIQLQRKEINSLNRDEQRLARLLERLRRLAEAKKAKPSGEPGKGAPVTPGQQVDRVADATLSKYHFSSLRGRLALPSMGEIVAKFGQARSGGGPSWKGLFIRSRTGQPVRAVGSGEVVFSDWLRGFGNLLIVDHGEGYLSLYSNNESLYKQAGDSVRAGDVIATIGNTGGHDEPGLYFELRRQGQPFDPMSWVR